MNKGDKDCDENKWAGLYVKPIVSICLRFEKSQCFARGAMIYRSADILWSYILQELFQLFLLRNTDKRLMASRELQLVTWTYTLKIIFLSRLPYRFKERESSDNIKSKQTINKKGVGLICCHDNDDDRWKDHKQFLGNSLIVHEEKTKEHKA